MKSCMPATQLLQLFLNSNVPTLKEIGGVQKWHSKGNYDQCYEIKLKYAIGLNVASLNNDDDKMLLSEYGFDLTALAYGGMVQFVFQTTYNNPTISESDEVLLPILCAPEVTQEKYRATAANWGLSEKEVEAGVSSLKRFQQAISKIDPIYLGHFFDEGDPSRSDTNFDPLMYMVGAA